MYFWFVLCMKIPNWCGLNSSQTTLVITCAYIKIDNLTFLEGFIVLWFYRLDLFELIFSIGLCFVKIVKKRALCIFYSSVIGCKLFVIRTSCHCSNIVWGYMCVWKLRIGLICVDKRCFLYKKMTQAKHYREWSIQDHNRIISHVFSHADVVGNTPRGF